jgi:hypothetical protein
MKRNFAVILILLMLGSVPCLAQQPAGAWLNESDQAKLESLRADGFEALFNLDYERARKDFREIMRLFPSHPAGPQFLATGLWIETLYETRRLQASLYSSDSFYSPNDDKADPKVVEQFRTLTRQARLLTEARLKQFPKDTEALYFLGAIEGLSFL